MWVIYVTWYIDHLERQGKITVIANTCKLLDKIILIISLGPYIMRPEYSN